MAEARDYQDDLSITNDAQVWRRVPDTRIVVDDDTGERRPSSQAFNDDDHADPMSVYLADTVQRSNRSPESILESFPGYGLVAVTAGHIRDCQLGIFRSPTAKDLRMRRSLAPRHAKCVRL